jgi:hypothetical protein
MKKSAFCLFLLFVVNFCYAYAPPKEIMSKGRVPRDALVSFLLKNNHHLSQKRAKEIVDLYIAEANIEGVNYEIAIAQMCYHTRYLSYKGTFVTPQSNNFGGLSSLKNHNVPHIFDTCQKGIRAHIQHLKGYASKDGLVMPREDPRYYKIKETFGFGSSRTVNGLSNKWAGPDYANDLNFILGGIYAYM